MEKKTLEVIQRKALLELCRRDFYEYCKFLYPSFYKDDRFYLEELCKKIQDFWENSDKRFLVVNMPPRFGKSFTGQNFVQWVLGNDKSKKVMTISYNDLVSSNFSRKVRDEINKEKLQSDLRIHRDIFRDSKIERGNGGVGMWRLEGSSEINYLSSGIGGTATGFGCSLLLVDDVIKNVEEAYNLDHLEKIREWFFNTMLSRIEKGGKCVVIGTRWCDYDLSGILLNEFSTDCEQISMKAYHKRYNEYLCEDIFGEEERLLREKGTNRDIYEANYNQKPVNREGLLYDRLKTYSGEIEGSVGVVIDTADSGNDNTCGIFYKVIGDDVFIVDVVYTKCDMNKTEKIIAEKIIELDCVRCSIEANNGGRFWGEILERRVKSLGKIDCIFEKIAQKSNKESKILASSGWVKEHIYFPDGWIGLWKEFSGEVLSYNSRGKNKHDDGVDVLAELYKRSVNGTLQIGINSVKNDTRSSRLRKMKAI